MKAIRDCVFDVAASCVVVENQRAILGKFVDQESFVKVHCAAEVGEEKQWQGVRLSKATESEVRAIDSDELSQSSLVIHIGRALISLYGVGLMC